jgi:hypothetical protein
MRSLVEIVEKIKVLNSIEDYFGAERSELVQALPFEEAKPWLAENAEKADWTAATATDELVRTSAAEYLRFAIGKAENHRGISASRSIDHFRGWVWLSAPREIYDQFLETSYTNYGAPQLKFAATALGLSAEWAELAPEGSGIERMSRGLDCDPDGCESGCGS